MKLRIIKRVAYKVSMYVVLPLALLIGPGFVLGSMYSETLGVMVGGSEMLLLMLGVTLIPVFWDVEAEIKEEDKNLRIEETLNRPHVESREVQSDTEVLVKRDRVQEILNKFPTTTEVAEEELQTQLYDYDAETHLAFEDAVDDYVSSITKPHEEAFAYREWESETKEQVILDLENNRLLVIRCSTQQAIDFTSDSKRPIDRRVFRSSYEYLGEL